MREFLYDWGGFNVWLFHAINNLRSAYLDQFMLLGTALGDHTLFPFYIAISALVAAVTASQRGDKSRRWLSVLAVFGFAYLLDGQLLVILKPLLDFPRPPLALPPGSMHIVGVAEYHHSLPSGHSSFAMLLIASLWPVLSWRMRAAGIFFVFWVGISRISLGAHFPADVLAGFLSSLAVVLIVSAIVQRLMRPSLKRNN